MNKYVLIGIVGVILLVVVGVIVYFTTKKPKNDGWTTAQTKDITTLLKSKPLYNCDSTLYTTDVINCIILALKPSFKYQYVRDSLSSGTLPQDIMEVTVQCMPEKCMLDFLGRKYPDISKNCLKCVYDKINKMSSTKLELAHNLLTDDVVKQMQSKCSNEGCASSGKDPTPVPTPTPPTPTPPSPTPTPPSPTPTPPSPDPTPVSPPPTPTPTPPTPIPVPIPQPPSLLPFGGVCKVSSDCQSNICSNGKCVDCAKTSDCGTTSQFCQNSKCVNYVQGFCRTDANCPNSKCRNINKYSFDGLGKCIDCVTTADCGSTSQFCQNSKCVNYVQGFCRTDANCPNSKCQNINKYSFEGLGKCIDCTTTADCSNKAQFCQNNKCVNYVQGFCRTDENCPNSKCRNINQYSFDGLGQCIDCIATADCSDKTQFCQNSKCVNYVQGFCRDDSNCQPGLECTGIGIHFQGIGSCTIKITPKDAIAGVWKNSSGIVLKITADPNGNLGGTFNGIPMSGFWTGNSTWKLGTFRGTVDALMQPSGQLLVSNFGTFTR